MILHVFVQEIRCWPPDTAEPGDKEVKVSWIISVQHLTTLLEFIVASLPEPNSIPSWINQQVIIANNSLNYSVGFLRYRTTSTSSSDSSIDIIVVILPVIAGVIILLLTCLAVLVGAIALAMRRRKLLKASRR